MEQQTFLQKIFSFFVTRIIIGLVAVGGSVALIEWGGRLLPDRSQMTDELRNLLIAIIESAVALLVYFFLFRFYEKRKIEELGVKSISKNAVVAFLMGLTLQALFIFIIYLCNGYSIVHVNPLSSLIPGFTAALTAGFVAEIFIIGIIFRLVEERLGTFIAITILTLIFIIAHATVKDASLLSIASTAIQAGFLISASYVFTRSLWFPIFFHFAWDFAEPGIFGGINPGISINQSLLVSRFNGPEFISGGPFGPVSSIESLIICIITGVIFLWLAGKKNNFIKPYWIK